MGRNQQNKIFNYDLSTPKMSFFLLSVVFFKIPDSFYHNFLLSSPPPLNPLQSLHQFKKRKKERVASLSNVSVRVCLVRNFFPSCSYKSRRWGRDFSYLSGSVVRGGRRDVTDGVEWREWCWTGSPAADWRTVRSARFSINAQHAVGW